MVWGDPFDKFYKDDETRAEKLIKNGITPGILVSYGSKANRRRISLWTEPDISSSTTYVYAGVGTVIAVDCETDSTTDWLYVLFVYERNTTFGWVPLNMTKKVT